MESLEKILAALARQWSNPAICILVETLVIHLSTPGIPKKEVTLIWKIAFTLNKTLPADTKSSIVDCFKKATANFHLQLKFFKRLGLPNNLMIFARFIQIASKTTPLSKLPRFQVDFDPNFFKSAYLPGALYVSRPKLSEQIIEFFSSKFLVEKVAKEDRKNLYLFKEIMGQLSLAEFSQKFHGQLKRLCVRSASSLPVVKEICEILECDMSEFLCDLTFPILIEYLNKPEDCQNALDLLSVLIKRSRSMEGFTKQLTGIRNLNEFQSLSILQIVSMIPKSEFDMDVLDYVTNISQRIKSEANKGAIATSIRHLVDEKQTNAEFLLSNSANPYFANIIHKISLVGNINFNQSNPMAIISVLSLRIPEPITAKIQSFLTDPTSLLFSIQNLTEDEALALTRAVLNGLKYYPENINLIRRFCRSVVSKYRSVRKFCLENLPKCPLSLMINLIIDHLSDETNLESFIQSFYSFINLFAQRISSKADVNSLLTLISLESLRNKKRLKFGLNKHSEVLKGYGEEVFEITPECAGIALSTAAFEDQVKTLLETLDYTTLTSTKTTLAYVSQVFDDPNFEEIGKFNAFCREIVKKANMPSEAIDSTSVLKALDTLWNRALLKASFIVRSFINALNYRKLNKTTFEFFQVMSFKALPYILRLTDITELQGDCWYFFHTLLSVSPNFSNISWHFTVALFKSSRNQWSDKSLSSLFKFIAKNINITRIENSEGFALERVVQWVLRQPGTSLRATSLSILIDFLHAGKFSDLTETINEICVLIESYSSPLVNSLFQPLLDIVQPNDWRAFLKILLRLQPNSKQILLDNLLQYTKLLPNEPWVVTPVYLCLFDEIDLVSSSASDVWEKNKLQITIEVVIDCVLPYLFHENLELALMTANALQSTIANHCEWIGAILETSFKRFIEAKSKVGLGKLLTAICSKLTEKRFILSIEEFILEKGICFSEMRSELLEVAIQYLNTHGDSLVNEFFTLIQMHTTHSDENIRNSAVVLAGYLAKFFNPDDFRIESTIDLLLKSLDMPSELLFSTVSKCLPRLVSFRQGQVEQLLQQEFKKLLENKGIHERRGAGYGIGCLVKGGGLKTLVAYNVLDKLEVIINNKKSPEHEKAAVLIAIEGLGAVLGRSFEPYLGEVLPFIIDCFANKELQNQAAISTKVMISRLSAHGMRRILPQLTHGLEETKWRSKVGAIEALGKMAFCAPKQLSAALPSIVPQVIKAFSDTNPKVLEAANMAISDIGSVITNPEIFQLVPVLSKALGDISHLPEAFKVLIETTFHHYLDTASLSLIVPLIETGLKSRNSEYKKQACQIVGGIASLLRTSSEFSPYIDRVTTAMKSSLFDSLPEVRNIAAQNLASFCEAIGSEYASSILAWLLTTMEKSNLNFERSGAIHAYSEYLLYRDRWESELENLLKMCKNGSTTIKESYLGLFIFIPLNTQGKFEKHLRYVLPLLLERLSDDSEEVRKIVIRVMQLIIQTYCKSSLDIILPHLEQGLFDKNWRKRLSCITLIGEMIEKIESLSRKENQQLISIEHKNRILASVYILKADNTSNINSQAAQIWKAHVDNTPKFLVTLTPELVLRLIEISDNNDLEPREIAAFAIQNLIQKYQNKIFSSYLKHFLTHFSKYPKGVAFVLRTVCESASRNLLVTYSEPILSILEVLLKSDDLDYLHNAGGIFHDMFQKTNIERPDPAVIALLDKMVSYPNACKELLSFKNIGITKALLPKIMASPDRAVAIEAIGKIIADEIFTTKGLEGIFPSLLKECETQEHMIIPVQLILASISVHDSLNIALNHMQELIESRKQLQIITYFVKNTGIVYESFTDRLLGMVLASLGSEDPEVFSLIPVAVKEILSHIDKEQLADYFQVFKTHLNQAKYVPLFNVPKGLEPFLPLIQNSLMYGKIEIKELAARSYCEVIELTNIELLNSYAVMIVGPLIRVLSEKVPGDVKVSILDALYLLLQKTPLKLKPFVSQLQSTFTKALTHGEENVRDSGGRNIIELLKLKPRLDLLFGDLGTLKGSSEVVAKSLEILQKIIKATEIPSQLLSSTCNRIIMEISDCESVEVAAEAGKLLRLINMDLSLILENLEPIGSSFIFLASFIKKSPVESLNHVIPFIDNGIKANFEYTMEFLEIVSESFPSEAFNIMKRYLKDISKNILQSLGLLYALQPDLLLADEEALAIILPALARECLRDIENEQLKQAVRKIFLINDQGIKNVLRSLHLLEEDIQSKFRTYVQKFN